MGANQETYYQIQVEGWIDHRWADRFYPLALAARRALDGTPVTTLSGPVVDQAALRGILGQLWDLNATLLSVARVDAEFGQDRGGKT